MVQERSVLIGKKGTMAYVLAVVTQMNQQQAREITIKARGKAISRAVDVAEIVRHKFVKDASVHSIGISTEDVKSHDGTPLKVSAIEIKIVKP